MASSKHYYVYCYVDPRDGKPFYYGKGKGRRSLAHLADSGKSPKTGRIRQIRSAGLNPAIRIVATGLRQAQALLIETALIWELGESLTNRNRGCYARMFRPQNSFDRTLYGFERDAYLVNIGEGPWCSWNDCRTFGFLRAGHGKRYSDQIRQLGNGDVVVAYLRGSKERGYVGVGRVVAPAVRVGDFRYGRESKSLRSVRLECPNIFENADDPALCEYLVRVRWFVKRMRKDAIWRSKYGLFTTRNVRASLTPHATTLRFIEQEWDVDFQRLLEQDGS